MVFVSVSETYDLSTKANKMTLIGIHTPSKNIIQKTYPGLCMQSKYCRIVKQDVVLACASTMPMAANVVGYGSDDVAPEDMFNPILYKAVSNDSMSTLEARLAGLQQQTASSLVFSGESVVADNTNVTGLSDEFNVYYALLSNRDGFRTANPQQGLSMNGLVPLVFEKYYNYGMNASSTVGTDNFPDQVFNGTTQQISNKTIQSMRGRAHPMPKFNTTYLTNIVNASTEVSGAAVHNGMGDGMPLNANAQMPEIMPVYTAMIVMPPSKLHQLYYRLVVRTTLEFTEVRPIQEIIAFGSMDSQYASLVYQSDYATQSKIMTATEGMVDVKDGEVTKIMEGA